MKDGRIFLKNLRDTFLNRDLSNEPLSAGSISLDSTFNDDATGHSPSRILFFNVVVSHGVQNYHMFHFPTD
jgi:hypothetical protein